MQGNAVWLCSAQLSSLQASAVPAVGQTAPGYAATLVSTVVEPHVASVHMPVDGAVHANHTSLFIAVEPNARQMPSV